jgi:hypothetical protein
MRIRSWLLAAPVAVGLAACNSALDVAPSSSIPTATAITDAAGARAALTGAYAALQAGGLYYGGLVTFPEVASDNGQFSGTLTGYADADHNAMHADNTQVASIWSDSYAAINRDNEILASVPTATGLSTTDRDEILGEAYGLRALEYHNLVKLFGGVPLVLQPQTSVSEAATSSASSSRPRSTTRLATSISRRASADATRSHPRRASSLHSTRRRAARSPRIIRRTSGRRHRSARAVRAHTPHATRRRSARSTCT